MTEEKNPREINKLMYKESEELIRKWISIYRKVNEHGDKRVYERLLTEAFNLTELVLDNYIDYFKNEKFKPEQIKVVDKDVYLFPGYEKPISFRSATGFAGKIIVMEKLGFHLPNEIQQVRTVRNKYTHTTETYKDSEAIELNDFKTFKLYIATLGKTICAVRALPKARMYPDYEGLKLHEGDTLGKKNEYSVLELIHEGKNSRVFLGRSSILNDEVKIVELIPSGNPKVLYDSCRELLKVRGNGIVRTLDVVFENQTCYLIHEHIKGQALKEYIVGNELSLEQKEYIFKQIQNIIRTVGGYPNLYVNFNSKNLVVDDRENIWLTLYRVGESRMEEKAILDMYKEELGLNIVKREDVIEIETEETSTEIESTEQKEDIETVVQLNLSEIAYVENDYKKLGKVVGVCSIILFLLWAISGFVG